MQRQVKGGDIGFSSTDAAWQAHCQANFGVPGDVDLRQLASQKASLYGAFGVQSLSRALGGLPVQRRVRTLEDIKPDGQGVVWFELKGQSQTGRRDSAWLKVQTALQLTCQRCMQSMSFVVDEQVTFELFEAQSQIELADSDEQLEPDMPEPLLVNGPVSLVSLIEDQIILALPYVPKHLKCEGERPLDVGQEIETKRDSPFQMLEKLKQKKTD